MALKTYEQTFDFSKDPSGTTVEYGPIKKGSIITQFFIKSSGLTFEDNDEIKIGLLDNAGKFLDGGRVNQAMLSTESKVIDLPIQAHYTSKDETIMVTLPSISAGELKIIAVYLD